MRAERIRLVLVLATLLAAALATLLPALAARRGSFVYDGFEMGFQRGCRDGVEIFIDYVEPSTRILGDLTRTGQRVLDQQYTLAPHPSRPAYFTITTAAPWTSALLPGDRVQLIERRTPPGGGDPEDLARGYVTVADCRLADATAGVFLYGPGSLDDIPDALAQGLPEVLYLYGQQSATHSAYAAVLAQLGFAVEARSLLEAAGLTSGQLDGYAHVIVADDTGTVQGDNPVWAGSAPLLDALGSTSTSILGIGAGGYALFNTLGTSIAARSSPISRSVDEVAVVRTNFNEREVWPRGSLPAQLSLFAGATEVVAGIGQPAIVQRRAVALLPLAGDPSELVAVAGEPSGGRCLSLWSFRASPAQLTGLGKSLLARVVAETACTGLAAGARTADAALEADDAITIARSRVFLCIDHPAASRLEILLLAPDGRVIELVGAAAGKAGGFGQNAVTTGCDPSSGYNQNAAISDDSGYALASGSSPYADRAFGATDAAALAGLRGGAAEGVWVLRVRDVAPGPQALSDIFATWALEFEAAAPATPDQTPPRAYLPLLTVGR